MVSFFWFLLLVTFIFILLIKLPSPYKYILLMLVVLTIASDIFVWALAKWYVYDIRRDEIESPIKAIIVNPADDWPSHAMPSTSMLERYNLDHYYFIYRDNVYYEYWDRDNRPMETLLQAHTFHRLSLSPVPGARGYCRGNKNCLYIKVETPNFDLIPRRYPFFEIPPSLTRWPVVGGKISVLALPDGRAFTRGCVSYHGGFWEYFTQWLFTFGWFNDLGEDEPWRPENAYNGICDEPLYYVFR
jgi:hypothetical protein